ncbi:MAG: hypothetical protein HeimC3_42850 [Candidatus Heimdallarchaeota archaeon LC_3]|nr:MAG: hypothetical protein HeimC3_42850 [Candidatus Heimdallarchaeota archaeon LC_3]
MVESYSNEDDIKTKDQLDLEYLNQDIIGNSLCYRLSCFDKAEKYCEKCNEVFCSSHLNVYWSQNFLQHAFVGQKRQFISETLCHKCERSNRFLGVFLAFFLLFPFLFTPLLILFG